MNGLGDCSSPGLLILTGTQSSWFNTFEASPADLERFGA